MRAGAVVVGYDGSPDAVSALSWAADIAVALGVRLRIVHAVGLLEHSGMAGSVPSEAGAVGLAYRAGLGADRVEWRVVDGDPCSALLRASEDHEPAVLIVVGSRGSGAHAGTLLGSTGLELAEHAPVPVAIVPTGRNQVGER
jgi:nucleotide-binding universal stress UspA family protein